MKDALKVPVEQAKTAPHPGNDASAGDILELANSYRDAASLLMEQARRRTRRSPAHWAPARLCALHAIELYLNAFLRSSGLHAREVRKILGCHDLSKLRADPDAGLLDALNLRGKTVMHLERIAITREYLCVRYAPDKLDGLAELNRLQATLKELSDKIGPRIAPDLPAAP